MGQNRLTRLALNERLVILRQFASLGSPYLEPSYLQSRAAGTMLTLL